MEKLLPVEKLPVEKLPAEVLEKVSEFLPREDRKSDELPVEEGWRGSKILGLGSTAKGGRPAQVCKGDWNDELQEVGMSRVYRNW